MHEPPAAEVCSPAHLFRVLTSGQPRWPLTYKPPGLERFKLEARGLSSSEAGLLIDDWERHDGERDAREDIDIVATALLADGRPAFSSAKQVGALPTHIVEALAHATRSALGICSPLYKVTNDIAWERALRIGARENWRVALALASCTDDGRPRPDRYWGRPLIEITDGQWMAFRAAQWFADQLPKPQPLPPPRQPPRGRP